MRWRGVITMKTSLTILTFWLLVLDSIHTCDGARRTVQRRKDATPELFLPAPTPESLQAFAQAMGVAGFEAITEGKSLVKRLIPANTQPDLDVVEHQGVIGRAGVDFPALPNIPSTGFNCKNVPTGYYADLETDCQVFHICDTSRKISFLCPNGTIFSQSHLICDWWFKVDCASAPALYESSVEYYSNEQKKSHKVSQSLTRNPDLQQIGADTNVRAESRRLSVNVPSTTERLLKHKQKLHSDVTLPTTKATARSYQALFEVNPTQRAKVATAFERRRKNLVQLVTNNFGNPPPRSTTPTNEVTTHKTTPLIDYNSIKEMQVVAESASFANNQNRQFLQQYNSKNFRPYPVYTPNLTASPVKAKGSLTTLYDIQARPVNQYVEEATTKRQTLVPYTKSYASTLNERRELYTRPGVSLLRNYLEREKNKTTHTTTEKINQATARSDKIESEKKLTIETKNNFESVTKIPQTTRNDPIADIQSYENVNIYSNPNPTTQSSDASYQERRERLIRKLNFEPLSTESTPIIYTDKYYGDQPNRPGLVVPPSLTPKTLHSLAIYYATALDNLSTTTAPEENEVTTPAIDQFEPIDDGLPGLFSRQTINKYSNLFDKSKTNAELLEEMKLDPNETYNELVEDLSLQMSQSGLASSPQIRELAQVFTHALSAYLQDPIKFRKVLSDIRPTQPSFSETLITTEQPIFNTDPTTTVNEDDHEILGFSDDHKGNSYDNSLRGGKALNLVSDYTAIDESATTFKPTTTTIAPSTTDVPTTPRNPFRCCGRISASYTTAPTPVSLPDTSFFTNYPSFNLNTVSSTESDRLASTDSYGLLKYESEYKDTEDLYGKADGKLIDDYSVVTNLPTAWGVDVSESTPTPVANSHQIFESKRIKPTSSITETTPIYFSETDSIELDNEEELQRAHSQSFVGPQSNSLRQGKQLRLENKVVVKKPSEDLEAPTQTVIETTTVQATAGPSTTEKDRNDALATTTPAPNNIFTSSDSDKPFSENQWSTPLENWQSTIIDPITLNDGLSPTGPEQGISEIAQQTNSWALNTGTTPPTVHSSTYEPVASSTVNIELTSTATEYNGRFGRLLRDSTSTEAQDITTMDTVVEKAKEIMEGMNATTTRKLMNVMKKTKSSTVKRLILLLVQTCDDDHNKTAEASKKALLDALMAVSQKDMDEMVNEELATDTSTTTADIKTTEIFRRSDRIVAEGRRGKSVNLEAKAINSLSNPITTSPKTTTLITTTPTVTTPTATTPTTPIVTTPTTPISTNEITKTEETEGTTASYVKTTVSSRRGGRKFQTNKISTADAIKITTIGPPVAEARRASQADLKENSDTRALELLRSLYTIASRWG